MPHSGKIPNSFLRLRPGSEVLISAACRPHSARWSSSRRNRA